MAILWTGLGNWSIWKINWQKKCSWFSVRMFVLAQKTGRWWDFLSAAMQIYASLKCLPNYSLSLALRVWFSQNLPLKIQTQFKKSSLAMCFFFLNFSFFTLLCSVWDSVLVIRNAFYPPRVFYNNFIQKLGFSAHQVILCNMYSRNIYFLQMKTDFPHTPSFKSSCS